MLLSAFVGLPHLSLPSWVSWMLQIMLGMLVGLRMSREELRSGLKALIPASLVTTVLISSAVVSALVAVHIASIDLVTALFAAAPGGLTEMSLISIGFGADGAAVATVQMVRILLALAVINVLLRRFEPASGQEENAPAAKTGIAEDLKRLGAAAPWGVLGGLVGILLSPIPVGGIIGALVGSAAYRLLTNREVPLRKFQFGVQALAGGIIGFGVSGEFLREFVRLAGAGALIISIQMLLWLAIGWLLARFFRYGLPTATLASSPGGMSTVISTAGEAGADTVIVTFIHLMRLSTIIIFVPVLVSLILNR